MKLISLGKYKVFSPNNTKVKCKHFNDKAKAYAYYNNLIRTQLGGSEDTGGTQLQLVDTKTGEIIDHGEFLGEDVDGEELLRQKRLEIAGEDASWSETITEYEDGSRRIDWTLEESPVAYKVFSPNSNMVEAKDFDRPIDALKYYHDCGGDLMGRQDSVGVKLQCEDSLGLLIKRLTILNDLEHRCGIETGLMPNCDLNDPKYQIAQLIPQK